MSNQCPLYPQKRTSELGRENVRYVPNDDEVVLVRGSNDLDAARLVCGRLRGHLILTLSEKRLCRQRREM